MSTYLVHVHEKALAIYRVEADSEDEALDEQGSGDYDPIDYDRFDSVVMEVTKEES